MTNVYLVRELLVQPRAYENLVSVLSGQDRLVPWEAASLAEVGRGSLVVTDLPCDVVQAAVDHYIVLHEHAVQALLGLPDTCASERLFSVPTRPGYYHSTVLCGARVMVSGYKDAAPDAARGVQLVARQLGADVYRTDQLDSVLACIRSGDPLYIVVPSSRHCFRFLSALIAHQQYLGNQRIGIQLTDDDVRAIAKAMVTEDLLVQLMHNRTSPQLQLKLLSRETFVPVLHGLPLHIAGDIDTKLRHLLALTGAAVVLPREGRRVSLYAASIGARSGRGSFTFFAQTASHKAYVHHFSRFHRIPRVYGQYLDNLAERLARHLSGDTAPTHIAELSAKSASMSMSAVLASGNLATSCPDNARSAAHSVRHFAIIPITTFSEAIVSGLLAQSLGCQHLSRQDGAKTIFRRQHDVWSDNYICIKHCQKTYNEILALLHIRPIVCSFCTLDGVSLPSDALLTLIDSAIQSDFQRLVCYYDIHSNTHAPRVELAVYTVLREALHMNVVPGAMDTFDATGQEPNIKHSQATPVDAAIKWLLSRKEHLSETLQTLIYHSILLLPFTVLPSLYSFVKERLFVIADPSLFVNMSKRLVSASSGFKAQPVTTAAASILEELRNLRSSLALVQLVPAKMVDVVCVPELEHDIRTCFLNGVPVQRNYTTMDATMIVESIEPESVHFSAHTRSMVWLQLVIEQLLVNFMSAVVTNKDRQTAQTPFCLFASLTKTCLQCTSEPAFPDDAALLSRLCTSVVDTMELSGIDFTKLLRFDSRSPPGFTHWSLFAAMDTQSQLDLGSVFVERACARKKSGAPLCRVCSSLHRLFSPEVRADYLKAYRQSVYARLSRTLMASLMLVWPEQAIVNTLLKSIGTADADQGTLSVLDFRFRSTDNTGTAMHLHTRLEAVQVHFPTFLAAVLRERGNYGMAETRGRREYMLLHQKERVVGGAQQDLVPAESDGVDLPHYYESTAADTRSAALLCDVMNDQYVHAFTALEESLEDPRFKRCGEP